VRRNPVACKRSIPLSSSSTTTSARASFSTPAEEHPLVLFFDDYERTDEFLDPWLRASLSVYQRSSAS